MKFVIVQPVPFQLRRRATPQPLDLSGQNTLYVYRVEKYHKNFNIWLAEDNAKLKPRLENRLSKLLINQSAQYVHCTARQRSIVKFEKPVRQCPLKIYTLFVFIAKQCK